MNADRKQELRAMLLGRRREVAGKVVQKLHENLDQGVRRRPGPGYENDLEAIESSDFGIQEDIEIALIQMKVDTLNRIDQALSRLNQGLYGHCFECGGEISEKRLRALPFALRCKNCEEAREAEEQRKRSRSHQCDRGPLFCGYNPRGG